MENTDRLTYENLMKLSQKFGEAFYILDSGRFYDNYWKLLNAFRSVYPKSNIAYSYKTNYIPKLCKIVDAQGGYAEVVSEMEMQIALKCGVKPEHIIWNGPVKRIDKVEELLLSGGTVQMDNLTEAEQIKAIARCHRDSILNVGIRCNFDVGDGVLSRFGFDTDGEDFKCVCCMIAKTDNLHLAGIQCHFAKRYVEFWDTRAEEMFSIFKRLQAEYSLTPGRIDLGGGIYGNMPENLWRQVGYRPPGYEAYAKAAKCFYEVFGSDGPELFIEPGTAIVADAMKFVARVKDIKKIRGKYIATVLGSQKNINMDGLNPPLKVVENREKKGKDFRDLDIAGYTCIESDYLYKHFAGRLEVGDFIVLGSCGSYSIVMKPPFILPDFPILDLERGINDVEVVKREETFEDLFYAFRF